MVTTDTTDGYLNSILSILLQLAYGLELENYPESLPECQILLAEFLDQLSASMNVFPIHLASGFEGDTTGDLGTRTPSTEQCSTSSASNHAGKKKGARTTSSRDSDDGSGEASRGSGRDHKVTKHSSNLRLSCPYRKLLPERFNVRQHYSCSMTYYTEFSKLR